MSISALASWTVALLTPYVGKSSEELAKKVGAAAFEGIGRLLTLVKGKLTGAAAESLASLEASPESEEKQAAFRKRLKVALEADPTFSEALQSLVKDVEVSGGLAVAQITKITGDNNKNTQISGAGNFINM